MSSKIGIPYLAYLWPLCPPPREHGSQSNLLCISGLYETIWPGSGPWPGSRAEVGQKQRREKEQRGILGPWLAVLSKNRSLLRWLFTSFGEIFSFMKKLNNDTIKDCIKKCCKGIWASSWSCSVVSNRTKNISLVLLWTVSVQQAHSLVSQSHLSQDNSENPASL